ncbi:MAG: CDP-alcohol phosphatidyltransferase family protein [Chloroflexi bacterium]|nr:CDP-alcohol phosphatidyltransferase family protein [Chloroflexota bacterium]
MSILLQQPERNRTQPESLRAGEMPRGNGGRVTVKSLRNALPTLVTLVALGCGLLALEAARVGDWGLALRLILLAAVADGVDGTVARRLRLTSALGEQLDSLSDVVAFVAAPAFLFMARYADGQPALRIGVALAFAAAGAYRLARFHAQPSPNAFCGLPVTAAGPAFAILTAGPFGVSDAVAATGGVVLALLMVSRRPFPKLAQARRRLLAVVGAAALVVAVWPGVDALAVAGGLAIVAYLAWGLLGFAPSTPDAASR